MAKQKRKEARKVDSLGLDVDLLNLLQNEMPDGYDLNWASRLARVDEAVKNLKKGGNDEVK